MSMHPMTSEVRDYVTANDHLQYSNLADGLVAIEVTHSNLPSKMLDIRFDLHSTIEDVKERLRKHIGTPVDYQRLLLRINGEVVCELADNSRMVTFCTAFSPTYCIHLKHNSSLSVVGILLGSIRE